MFRVFLYLSPQNLSLHSSFFVFTAPSFPNFSTSLFPIFIIPSFSLFTTNSNLSSLASAYNSFVHPPFNCFVLHDENTLLTTYNVIVDPSLPVIEPSLNYNSIIFDEWFGTPFTYSHHTAHIRTPHPSKNNFIQFIPFHPFISFTSFIITHPVFSLTHPLYLPL